MLTIEHKGSRASLTVGIGPPQEYHVGFRKGTLRFLSFFRLPPFTSGGHLHGFYNHRPILLEASYNYFDIFLIISTGARTRPKHTKRRNINSEIIENLRKICVGET